jgi:hypothetical protein
VGLNNGVDTVAFVSGGMYSETYGSAEMPNRVNLFCSYGLFEDAPDVAPGVCPVMLMDVHDGNMYYRSGKLIIELGG